MPLSTMPESALVSEDWELAEDGHKATCVLVQLRRSIHVMPWFRFAYAEGNSSKIHVDFGGHSFTVIGDGLYSLLEAVAQHRVIRLIQPMQMEVKMNLRGEAGVSQAGRPVIKQILVNDNDQVEAYQ
jgi:hypothetical protein